MSGNARTFKRASNGAVPATEAAELPLFDLETERAVLSMFMAYPYLIAKHAADLSENDFYEELHKQILRRQRVLATRNLNDIGPELITGRIDARLSVMGIDAVSYIRNNVKGAYRDNPEEVEGLIRELHLWTKRRAAKRISDLAQRLSIGGQDDLLDKISAEVTKAALGRADTFFEPLGPTMAEAIDHAFEMDAQGWKLEGLTTGFPEIDDAIGGFRKKCLYVEAGQEKSAKSSLMIYQAHRLLSEGRNVAIVSLEMSRLEVAQRLVMVETEVRIGHRKAGSQMTAQEKEALRAAKERVARFNIQVSQIYNLKPSTLRLACNHLMASDSRPEIIFLDYLQLVAGENDRVQTRERVEAASWALKEIAGNLDVPVVALAQLNRNTIARATATTFDKFEVALGRPRRGDLRETAKIEGDAHAILALYRPEIFLKELSPGIDEPESKRLEFKHKLRALKGKAEISVLLCRDGEDGVIAPAHFRGDIMKFSPGVDLTPEYSGYDPQTDTSIRAMQKAHS